MASFGDELKRERELRDISLKEISEATKISIRFLEALEQNNFDMLPGGVFNRGFIRAYARFIGVDGEEMVNAYLHEVAVREARHAQPGNRPQRPGGPAESAAAARAESRAPQRIEARAGSREESRSEIPPETRFTPQAATRGGEGRASTALWLLLIVALLVGGGIIIMNLLSGRTVDASAEGHAQALRARLSKKAAGPSPPAALEGGAGQQTPQDQTLVPEGSASVPPVETAPDATAGPAPLDANAGAQAAGDANVPAGAAVPAGGDQVPQPPPVPEHRVRIRALEATRVILECAGKVSLDQELWPGQSRTLKCVEPVVLSAANGGAVEYSLDDGPPALMGQAGQQIEGLTIAPLAPVAPAAPAAPSGPAAPPTGTAPGAAATPGVQDSRLRHAGR